MEEIELRELIEILIRGKKTIAIITLVAILIATIFSFVIMKPTYEAKMVLMTSNLGSTGTNKSLDTSSVEDMLDIMSQLPDLNLETYREQIKSPEVLSKTLQDLNLHEKYTIEGLSNRIILETIKDTQMIAIKMQNTDPEEAALVVNKLGENFITFLTEKAKERANRTFSYVETQMDIEKEKYEEALLELTEILSQPRGAKELGLELDSSFSQLNSYKSNLNNLEISRDALLSAIEESKSYTTDRGSVVAKPNLAGNLNISFDDSNKVLAIDLAETEGRIESTNQQISKLQAHIEEIQVEYQNKKYEEDVIKQKVNISKKTYESFVAKYEELRVAESAKIGELSVSVISEAYPPANPVGPRKALNLAISMVLGLMVGVFVVFFKAYWESSDKDSQLNGGEKIVN